MFYVIDCLKLNLTNLSSDDRHLVKSLREEGDMQSCMSAFEQLYNKYHGVLFRTSLKFIKSEELAGEIVQEVFVKLWENRQNLNEDLSFAAYLYTMARNHIFNMLKRSARESRIREQIRMHAATASNSTEDNLLFSEYHAVMNTAIAQLPPQRKRIFIMCRQEGRSYEEVAGTFGISKSTVRDHMVKALKSVREHLYLKTGISMVFGWLIAIFH
ncbi:RNA polymerase sigma-70 factor (ECF subfamily) [Anseongella ginsenosidimutans]|uniref:RNA polymerase sigma-70 factor (ECF subfamily) n=1 Tax=Anseongella ginsenosidimutans TaxID=496056 RepID=A0A4R3KYF1_9SPHI|nr:RNA polymerase sigma-70 factor (ECF subfamily) [Anseongella ginsenosidimutans]